MHAWYPNSLFHSLWRCSSAGCNAPCILSAFSFQLLCCPHGPCVNNAYSSHSYVNYVNYDGTAQPTMLSAAQLALTVAELSWEMGSSLCHRGWQKHIITLEFVGMWELQSKEWLHSVTEESDAHSWCNSTDKKRAPVTNIHVFTWFQGYCSLVRALLTAYPSKLPQFIPY